MALRVGSQQEETQLRLKNNYCYGALGRMTGALVLPRRVTIIDKLPLGRLSGSRMIT